MREEAEQFRDEAESLASVLLNGESQSGESRDDRESPSEPQDISPERQKPKEGEAAQKETWGYADIGGDVQRLLEQRDIYEHLGMTFPGLEVSGETLPVPIDVPSFLARRPYYYSERRFDWGIGAWPFFARQMMGGMVGNARIRGIPPEQVVDAARPSLVRSLANRIFGRGQPTMTSLFTVHCLSKGAAVHGRTVYFTPAYFITLGPYGSSQSTPVTASIRPGYYFLGADDSNGVMQFDRKKQRFDVPFNQAGYIDV